MKTKTRAKNELKKLHQRITESESSDSKIFKNRKTYEVSHEA